MDLDPHTAVVVLGFVWCAIAVVLVYVFRVVLAP